MSHPYIQELYVRRLHQYGWPPTPQALKMFGRKFYNDNSIHGPKLVRRAVSSIQKSLRHQKVVLWAKSNPQLEAMYRAVLADIEKKTSARSLPQNSTQINGKREREREPLLTNRQIKEEPTDEWKLMVIKKDNAWMNEREQQLKAQIEMKKDGCAKAQSKSATTHIKNEAPLQHNNPPIKKESHLEENLEATKKDAMVLKLKRTVNVEGKKPEVWKIVHPEDKSNNVILAQNGVKAGISKPIKDELYDWESDDDGGMSQNDQKGLIKRAQPLENDAMTMKWKEDYDAKHKAIVSKLKEDLKLTKFQLSQMSNKVTMMGMIIKDKELVIRFLKSQAKEADKSFADASMNYDLSE